MSFKQEYTKIANHDATQGSAASSRIASANAPMKLREAFLTLMRAALS